MSEKFCKICGEYFIGEKNEQYCSKECKQEILRIHNENRVMKNRSAYNKKIKTPNKLDEIMKECDRLGISYSEWKKKQILDGIERIQI